MRKAIVQTSHKDRWLDQGWLLALQFYEGWVCFRLQGRQWANLRPYVLETDLAALTASSEYDEIKDSESRHYLEPHDEGLIYHTFWGVTPPKARIFTEYPPRSPLGSMLSSARTDTGAVGYIDGDDSPWDGPFAPETEIFTVKEKYPQYSAYNPLNSAMNEVRMYFDQVQYTYQIVRDRDLIKDILIGSRRSRKFTMGLSWPKPTTLPDWLKKAISAPLLKYSLELMGGEE